MAKISVGDRFPDFEFSTPFRANVMLGDAVAGGMTALVFLRYYGCPVCQYDMHRYAEKYDRITSAGGKLFVVLQSDTEGLRKQLGDASPFPFEIICDPTGALYRRFEILPAKDKLKMLGPKTMIKIAKVQAAGFAHGKSEGEELQLPAAFALGPDLSVTYAHYAKTIDDIPDAEELHTLLQHDSKENQR
jgi:peroxiredoxin